MAHNKNGRVIKNHSRHHLKQVLRGQSFAEYLLHFYYIYVCVCVYMVIDLYIYKFIDFSFNEIIIKVGFTYFLSVLSWTVLYIPSGNILL